MRRSLAILLVIPTLLTLLGVAIIASTGDVPSLRYHGDPNYFLGRQLIFMAAAVASAAILWRIDYRIWAQREVMACLLLLILAGLVVVFVPGIAAPAKGSHRWINVGFTRLQPSEFVKLLLIVLMAAWHGQVSRRHDRFWEGFAIPGLVLAVVAVGFLKQPDLGSTFLAGIVSMALMFVSGVKFVYLVGVAMAGVGALVGMILVNPERMSRITSVYSQDAADSDDSHQIEQSLAALQSGGLWGVGYGNSLRKERFLPESHTDFILSMVGEELGLVCTLLVVVAYLLLLVGGMTVSLRCQDKFGRLLAFGMTFHLCFSAAFNIAVVTKMAPTKGLALPFMSYGGSNLIASMVALGFVLSVARRMDAKDAAPRRFIEVDTLPDRSLPAGFAAPPPTRSP